MADFNSSLPVRTQTNGDVAVKVVDATTVSQGLAIDASGRISAKLDDGSGNAVTSQANGAQRALDVGIDVAGVQIDPRSIRALTATDVVTVQQGTTPWADNVSQFGGTAVSLGQKVSASSIPVVIASDQSVINVKDASDGTVAPGAAAANSSLAGMVFNTAAPAPTNGQQLALQSDASGNLKVDIAASTGSISVTQGTTPWITKDSSDGSVAAGTAGTTSMLGGLVFNSTPPTLTTGQQVALQGDAAGNLKTNANLQVAGAAVSAANPVPVTLSTTAPGLAVQDYNTSAAVAAGSSATFTYTVAASHTFNLERVWASGSGKIKVVVQNGATTIFTGFNSTAMPNVDITVISPPTIAAAGTVNVIVTNLDLAAQDLYATIEGNQN
jgi:hypothetical protein